MAPDGLQVRLESHQLRAIALGRHEHHTLRDAAYRFFGSWRKAIAGAGIKWKDGKTTLRFIVTDKTMRVEQDSALLSETKIPGALSQRVRDRVKIDFGRGVFGPIGCELVSRSVQD